MHTACIIESCNIYLYLHSRYARHITVRLVRLVLLGVHPTGHLVDVQRSHVGRELSDLNHGLLNGGHSLLDIGHQLGVVKDATRHLVEGGIMVAEPRQSTYRRLSHRTWPKPETL